MTDRLPNVANLCTNPDNHKQHLCELIKAGRREKVAGLRQDPTVICGNCGETANTAGALCAPGPFHD